MLWGGSWNNCRAGACIIGSCWNHFPAGRPPLGWQVPALSHWSPAPSPGCAGHRQPLPSPACDSTACLGSRREKWGHQSEEDHGTKFNILAGDMKSNHKVLKESNHFKKFSPTPPACRSGYISVCWDSLFLVVTWCSAHTAHSWTWYMLRAVRSGMKGWKERYATISSLGCFQLITTLPCTGREQLMEWISAWQVMWLGLQVKVKWQIGYRIVKKEQETLILLSYSKMESEWNYKYGIEM